MTSRAGMLRTAAALAVLVLAAGCGAEEAADTGTQWQPPPLGCEQAGTPPPRQAGGLRRPGARLDPGRTYDVAVRTSCGTFRIRLDLEAAPNAAASFVSLVRRGFYNGTA